MQGFGVVIIFVIFTNSGGETLLLVFAYCDGENFTFLISAYHLVVFAQDHSPPAPKKVGNTRYEGGRLRLLQVFTNSSGFRLRCELSETLVCNKIYGFAPGNMYKSTRGLQSATAGAKPFGKQYSLMGNHPSGSNIVLCDQNRCRKQISYQVVPVFLKKILVSQWGFICLKKWFGNN